MGETEEARVLARFKKEVDEHLVIIENDVKKGDIQDAVLWVNELESMKEHWDIKARQAAAYRGWLPPERAEIRMADIRKEAARIAASRVAILDKAIRKGRALIESKT